MLGGKKMKEALLILIILATALIAGCEQQNTSTGAFIGGTKGLDMSFTENEPPEKVLDNNEETFTISVTLKNEGESTVDAGKVIGTLAGIDSTAFGMAQLTATNQNEIMGKEKYESDITNNGGTEVLSFGDAKYQSSLVGDFVTSVRANICYAYETKAIFNSCLKRSTIQRESDNDMCKIEALKSVENSGAPLQITNVRETVNSNNGVKITFNIEKVGDGKIYVEDAFSTATGCFDKHDFDDKKDRVTVIVQSQTSNIPIVCRSLGNGNQGVIRLSDDRGTVICDINTGSLQETAFESPINIKVRYTYMDSVEKEFTVKKSN
jgi:hypothetical protein